MRFQEYLDQELVDGFLAVVDLLVAARGFPAEFQTVQRALAGERLLARLRLAAEHSQQRVFPQLVVVGEVLVAKRQRVYALGHQLLYGMGNQFGPAAVLKTSRQARQQVDPPIGLRSRTAPPSELIVPPSKRATT